MQILFLSSQYALALGRNTASKIPRCFSFISVVVIFVFIYVLVPQQLARAVAMSPPLVMYLILLSIQPLREVFNCVSKVISRLLWFCFTRLNDWLAKFAPFSQPMGSQIKTNRALVARVFPHLTQVTCICFDF